MKCESEGTNRTGVLCFMVNPAAHSGSGMKVWKRIERILKEEQISYEVLFSQKYGDMAAFAKQLTVSLKAGEERTLVVLGGDGSVNEALQGIEHFEQVRLGYIPAGSSNDLARDMGTGGRLEDRLRAVIDGTGEIRMDVGHVSWTENGVECGRRFLISCGMGYDAAVCEEALSSRMKDAFNKVGLGKLTYLGIGLKQMIAIRYAKAAIRLDGERVLHLDKLLFVANMSHRFEGGGFCFCPQADAQDGLLDLCVVNGVPRWKFPVIIPFALKGKHYRFSGVEHYRASRVEIKTSMPLWVHTDGEIPGRMKRITITNEKQKLRFIY